MLGLRDCPTQSCARGSPLFCSLPSGGRKCSTNPPSVHGSVCSAMEDQPRNSPVPPEGARDCCLSHGNPASPPLTFSIVHVPSHVGK
uniref:Uncharacterized protein n=1 Tax=Varanus komodoensis TaxID=61221 RepID=A0A8D2J9Q6_VARKO